MCGVVALYSHHAPVAEAALRRALTALRHRGPDGEGVWLAPDGRVALGHRRLAVIDPVTGAQPIASEDAQIQAVVNGELYDFERLRRELEARGHRFRTGADSEILVHLYEEYGVECLQSLRGEFAFILWDQRNRRLFAARDRFGVKPLCYAVHDGVLALASEAKGLFAAGVKPAWDHGAFFQAAHLQYVPPDRTLFQGVAQLRPGHYLLAVDGRVQTYRYWDLDYPPEVEASPGAAEAEAVIELRERLAEAVRLRLRADVPVACYLSGGLDSSVVLGLAMRHSPRPLDCFTVSFEEEVYDERRIAAEMAARAGATFHSLRVTAADLVETLPDAVYFSEGLAINGHLPAKFLLSRAVRQAGYRVVLTGEGADEVMAGYAHLRRDLLVAEAGPGPTEAALVHLHATNAVSAGIMLPQGESLSLEAVRRALGFVPGFLEAKGTLGYRLRAVLSEEFLTEFARRDAFQVLVSGIDLSGQLAGRHPVNQSLYLWSKLALANYILKTLGDGTEMAHSVEGRVPFLDHHLFAFFRTLPLSLKIRGGVEKYLLREVARPFVTEALYRRQKHPFLAPPLSGFRSPDMDGLIQDTLGSECCAAVPFFDRAKLRAWRERLPRMEPQERAAADPVLMTALCAGILQQRFCLSSD